MSGRAIGQILLFNSTRFKYVPRPRRMETQPKPTSLAPHKMREAIKRAIEKAPTRKAAGIDEVKTEMLKVDTEMSTNLLYEIWDAWGRCGGASILLDEGPVSSNIQERGPRRPEKS